MDPHPSSQPQGGEFLLKDGDPARMLTPETFSETLRMIMEAARHFGEREIQPLAEEIEGLPEGLNASLIRKAGEEGLLAVEVPEALGGLGLELSAAMVVAEALGDLGSWSVTHGAHSGIGTLPILHYGTEAQQRKYLPLLASGAWVAAFCLSEADSGSDALAARAWARKEGDVYVLNGSKMWVTNAGFADLFIVFAKVDRTRLSAFLVERSLPGLSLDPEERKLGIRGSSTRVVNLEDVRVPAENLLGEEGRGHAIALNILNLGRLKLAASVLGGAKRSMAQALQYAQERHQFGRPIASFGMIQEKLGEMAIRIHVAESMVYRTVGMIEGRIAEVEPGAPDAARRVHKAIEEYAIECALLKVHGTEMLDFVVDEGLQIFGGYGYTEDYPLARAYRDARINRIFEGTNEINRLMVPAFLLRRSLKGELGLLAAAKAYGEDLTSRVEDDEEGLLAAEARQLRGVKRGVVMLFGLARQSFQKQLEEQQEVLGRLADLVMEVFAMDSVLLRTRQALARGEAAELPLALTRTFIHDACGRAAERAQSLLAATVEGDTLAVYLAALRRLFKRAPVNTIAARRALAQALCEKGHL